jgi:Amt family ammonium transporter
VRARAGIWGFRGAGLVARFPGQGSGSVQWLAQVIGIATLLGFVLPLTYSLNWLLDRMYPQRVEPDGERQGMDLHELGAGAYAECVVHGDEVNSVRSGFDQKQIPRRGNAGPSAPALRSLRSG